MNIDVKQLYFVQGVDEGVLRMLSKNIGSDWKRVGHHLKLKTAELEHIELDNKSTSDRIFCMLQTWCQKQQGSEDTKIRVLKRALTDSGYCIEESEATEDKVKSKLFHLSSLILLKVLP